MQLPETGFLRESQILPQREISVEEAERNRALPNSTRPKRARPATPGLIPVSHATWWRGIKDGRFPQPVKLGTRTTVWRVEDIRPDIAYFQTFFISGALAGAAGVIIGLAFNSVHFLMGEPFLLKAFVVIVLGGLGSIGGALVGGLLLGLIQTITVSYLSSSLSDAIIYSLLFGILLLRPSGLFGKLHIETRVVRS